MTDRRYVAWTALGSATVAVQIVRTYDGRIFGMTAPEARDLAFQLNKSADQADARRGVPQ